jgi:hypothetical protein
VQQNFNQPDGFALQARSAARALQFMMNSENMAPTFNVAFDPDALNLQLNSILFESPNLGEAMTELCLAQRQAEDFVSEIERALRETKND